MTHINQIKMLLSDYVFVKEIDKLIIYYLIQVFDHYWKTQQNSDLFKFCGKMKVKIFYFVGK